MKPKLQKRRVGTVQTCLAGRDLTKIPDLSSEEVELILDRAQQYQKLLAQGIRRENVLDGRVVALIFEKPSLRTKVAFEVATHFLGGMAVFLSSSQILASGGNERGRESVPDIARNLERFGDAIVARVYHHEVIQEMAESIKIPVINALCDKHHPTQALADLFTIRSHCSKPPQEISVAFIGDGNNVAASLMHICALTKVNFRIATPPGYEVHRDSSVFAHELAKSQGTSVIEVHDPLEAVQDADVVYTDTFVSMGQESEKAERDRIFRPYQVNAALMSHARPGALFMHCLPAHRGEEVTDEVMDSSSSIVFDQAEARLHIAKAIIALLLGC